MPFLFLLVFALTCFQSQWPEPAFQFRFLGSMAASNMGATSALLTWGGVAGLAAVTGMMSRRWGRRLHQHPGQRSAILRRFGRFRRYFLYALLLFYALALYLLGWGWVGGTSPGRQLILLAPFASAWILAWSQFYRVEKAAHDAVKGDNDPPFLGRLAYIGLQVRHNFLLVLPPLLLVLVEEMARELFRELELEPYLLSLFAAFLVLAAFLGFPLLLRLILGLQRLPDCPLRDRLVNTARRLGFRYSDILLWNTRGTIANGMVTGTVPFLRYVILTDRLVHELHPEEVEAVFGHEVGHIKHQHMLFYLCFLLTSLLALGAAWEAAKNVLGHSALLASWLSAHGILSDLPLLLALALYIFLIFGFLSRRCERQADIFGCKTVSCPVFIEALEKVARINGIHREKPGWLASWQHSTIARRVEFLQRLHADPHLEQRFQRRVHLIKWAVLLLLFAVLAAIWWAAGTKQVWAILQ